MRKGRPTKDPSGHKRMKMQPWVHKDTERAIRTDANREKLTIGEVLDIWFKERAGTLTRAAPKLKKRFDEPVNDNRLSEPEIDMENLI